MCGINGIVASDEKFGVIEANIQKMNNSIIHRGPDDDGFYFDEKDSFNVAMAMRRLSIIDLNTGKQPIISADESLVIVFNGEIYNYKYLRSKLEESGVLFKTNSDTEVILKMYEKFGTNSFGQLDGMFAFSIYDKKLEKIVIARDYFGEKPLYYYKTKKSFYWASELKAIIKLMETKPEISKNALINYFQLTYIPAPFTIYEGVYKLEQNHYLEVDCKSSNFEIKKIKEINSFNLFENIQFKEAKNITRDLVRKSVLSRSVSDVKIGSFLSGGVDSSIVSLCLADSSNQPIDTFSIGFEKKSFDESNKSRLVSKLIGSNHHEFIISEKDLLYDVNDVLLNFDEPFADSSAIPTYMVSKKAKNHVKVALTGDGGDEVFGGYNKYYIGRLNQRYTNLISENLHSKVKASFSKVFSHKDDQRGTKFKLNRLFEAINYNNDFYYNIISLGFQYRELEDLFRFNHKKHLGLNYYKDKVGNNVISLSDFREIDKILSLEGDLLVKVDSTSMLSSLECRAPFLNKELWNFTNQIPEKFLINGWDKKHLLKESFKSHFPKGFLNKSKKGFGVPVGDWLRKTLKDDLLYFIEVDFLMKQNIFNVLFVRKMVLDHIEGRVDNTFRVWTFYCFQNWYKASYNSLI